MNPTELSYHVKDLANKYGFLECGISKVVPLNDQKEKLKSWLERGYAGEMNYMHHHFEKRINPKFLEPWSESIISFAYNYYPDKKLIEEGNYKISKYAYGKDYHTVIKKKLKKLVQELEETIGKFRKRVFVDSAPIMEREWAKRSGLGWVGKHTLLINKKHGSYFFLAEILCDLKLIQDDQVSDHCGQCTRCIDACPTEAIDLKGYELNASKCISYLTIEHKNELPLQFHDQMNDWIFGCDICQDVCPWNRFSDPTEESSFYPKEELLSLKKEDWINLNEEQFNKLFIGSAVKRAKYKGLKRNIDFIS